MLDFMLQRRSLIQVLLISLLALILTVSLLLGGVLLWQGRAAARPPSSATPGAISTATPAAGAPTLSATAVEGGFHIQGAGWPGFSELTLSLLPRDAATAAPTIQLGAVVANARGRFDATFTWAAVATRQPGVNYDLAALPSAGDGRLIARIPFVVTGDATPQPGVTPPPPPATPTLPPTPDPACTVIADALNLRSGPGVAFSVIAGLPYRTTVRPLSRTASADWIEVALADGTAGWVTGSYLDCNVRIGDLPVMQTSQPTPTSNPLVPAISLAPAQGWAGTTVTVNGLNWPAGAVVFVSLAAPNAGPGGQSYASVTAGSDGRSSVSFVFPAEEQWLNLSQVIIVAHTQDYQRSASAPFGLIRPAPQISEWKGEYFANRNLSGAPLIVRNDRELNLNWGSAAPAAGLPADGFAVRWTRTLSFDAGDYRFYAHTDDGLRLWLDGWLVIDDWNDGGRLRVGDFKNLGAGNHTVRIEYFEAQGDAFAAISWERIGPISEWKGEYFPNVSLDDLPVLTRNERVVAFDWGLGSPSPQIGGDNFSARWTRKLDLTDGVYRFSVRADDGVRVWVDGQPLIDHWRDSSGETYKAEIGLTGGAHNVKVEYYERTGNALIQFDWQRIGDRTPIQPQITVTANESGQIVITGANWPASRSGAVSEVRLRLQTFAAGSESFTPYTRELGKAVTDSKGRFRATFAWPANLPDGVFVVAVSGKTEIKTPLRVPIITQPGVSQ